MNQAVFHLRFVTGAELRDTFDELWKEKSFYIVPKFKMLVRLVQSTFCSQVKDMDPVFPTH